jgi:hypothetical protein
MRPYLAILIDSFREAVHSRVLWVVLLCITVFFLIVLPFHFEEHVTTGVRERDVLDWTSLARRLHAAGEATSSRAGPERHIWERLDEEQRAALPQLIAGSTGGQKGLEELIKFQEAAEKLMRGLRHQLRDPEWYEPEPFKRVSLRREGRTIVRKIEAGEEVTDTERLRLNRLLLEAAFPESIDVSPAQFYSPAYFYLDSGWQMPWTREQLNEGLPQFVVIVMDWTFGVFGILAAMLVTASIVPQMFEPGSLHLLLSKPVSRSLLFLTKFLGGCIFALVSGAYFAGGVWLILGIRFDVWDSRLLAAIPVYAFVFAIYFSVTALAGLIFRNTIVSIVLGILFWALCWSVGVVEGRMKSWVISPQRILRLAPADDTTLAVFPGEHPLLPLFFTVREYDRGERAWHIVYRSQQEGPELFNHTTPEFGPYYDREHDQLVSLQGGFRGTENVISVAPRSNLWPRRHGTTLPDGTVALVMDRESRLLAITLDGIYRSTRNVADTGDGPRVLGIALPWGTAPTSFEKVSEAEWSFGQQPVVAAIDPSSDALAIYSRGRLGVWRADAEGPYSEAASHTLEGEEKTDMLLAIGGPRVVLGAGDGRILIFDSEKLEMLSELRPEEKNAPRQLRASPKGNEIAVLFAHGVLYTLDTSTLGDQLQRAPATGQRTISAIAYEPSGELLYAHHANRVSRLAAGENELLIEPAMTTAERLYYYAVHPAYLVLPKPGEVSETMLYLLTGKETKTADSGPRGMRSSEVEYAERIEPWRPIWSGVAFLVVMLTIGCVYMERMEF